MSGRSCSVAGVRVVSVDGFVGWEYGCVADSGHGPGRAGVRMRDMVGAMVVLVLIIGAVLAWFGGCSFSPGRPTVDPSSAPSADASKTLELAASSVEFPVRQPAVPSDWRPNSAATVSVGSGATANVAVRVGWVTSAGTYVQLSQSGGERADVLAQETGQEPGPARGEVEVAGVTWMVHPGHRDEPAWLTELPDGTVAMITGSATEDDFRRLATALQEAEPLPGR